MRTVLSGRFSRSVAAGCHGSPYLGNLDIASVIGIFGSLAPPFKPHNLYYVKWHIRATWVIEVQPTPKFKAPNSRVSSAVRHDHWLNAFLCNLFDRQRRSNAAGFFGQLQ